MSLNKWMIWPASSRDAVVRHAYMAGAIAAVRDRALEDARRASSPGMRKIWVARARFENHQMIHYLRLLRDEV